MYSTDEDHREERPLWDRILRLLEQDLSQRRCTKLIVEVPDEAGSYEKEIGELSISERQSLHPALREHISELLLDRYLTEKGYIDLIERRYAYRKTIEDLAPADLPAIVEADRQRIEEEHQEEHERAKFVREAQAGLEQLSVLELAET